VDQVSNIFFDGKHIQYSWPMAQLAAVKKEENRISSPSD